MFKRTTQVVSVLAAIFVVTLLSLKATAFDTAWIHEQGGFYPIAFGSPAGTPPTPAPGVTPVGVSAPEFGSWTVVTNDNFNTDSIINTALWNGGPGGPGGSYNAYFPFGWPAGNCPNTSAPLDATFDCIGYAGLSPVDNTEVNQIYEATNGKSGQTIVPGVGLESIAYMNYAGHGAYGTNQWTALQGYGTQFIQPNSFIEWKAQMPTNVAGESDGEHTDMWCTNSARKYLGTDSLGAEVDIAEQVSGTSATNHQSQTLSVFDANTTVAASQPYSAPGNPDLTAGMHTYGLWWKQYSGGSAGSFSFYVDGSLVSGSPFSINSTNWYNPGVSQLYCFTGYMDPSFSYAGYQGAVVGPTTVDPGVPLKTQYFRYWVGGPSPTPTPTPTPGPGPVFVDRSETSFGNCNGTTAATTFTPNTTPTNGNLLVALVGEYAGGTFTSATPPSGWTSKGTYTNTNGDKVDVWTHTYSSSDSLPYTAGGGPNLCAVKIALRDYGSATGPDAINGVGALSSGGCTTPALAATAHNNEAYVGWMTSDSSGHSLMNIPSGWLDTTTNATNGWSSIEGDFAIPTSGTVPSSQAITLASGTGNNVCTGVTIY